MMSGKKGVSWSDHKLLDSFHCKLPGTDSIVPRTTAASLGSAVNSTRKVKFFPLH